MSSSPTKKSQFTSVINLTGSRSRASSALACIIICHLQLQAAYLKKLESIQANHKVFTFQAFSCHSHPQRLTMSAAGE